MSLFVKIIIMDKFLYFAYGSNLNHEQMKKRCPHALFLDAAELSDMQLTFYGTSKRWGGAPATVKEQTGSAVWGALYELDAHCLKLLDSFEAVATGNYRRELVTVRDTSRQTLEAYIYLKLEEEKDERKPSEKYMETIIAGAVVSKLPEAYITKLKSISTL